MRDAPSYYRQMKDRLLVELCASYGPEDLDALFSHVDRLMDLRGEQAERDQIKALEDRQNELRERRAERKKIRAAGTQ